MKHALIVMASVLLAACALPPKNMPAPALQQAVPVSSALQPQTSMQAEWPAANWWSKYHDDTLDKLIEQALATAPSLASAEARFNSAREQVRVTAAADGLRVDASADVSRQRLSDNGLFSPKFLGFNWYNQADLGLRANYSFDWWHKRRDAITAALDDARAAQAQQRAAAMSLSAAIADSYFGWQADQAQLNSVHEQQQLAEKRRDIIQARVTAQLESIDGIYNADAEIAALREGALSWQYSAQLRRVVLAALLGINPDALPAFTAQPLPAISLQLPNNVSIDLLARRTDISASRWQVEAAQQRLSAARAEFLPDISLNALAGLSSIELGKLFEAGSAVPSVGAAIHLPIFDSGRLAAQYGARAAQVITAIRNYNETVVNAARDVATQALKLQQLAAQHAERQAQTNAATQLVEVTSRRNQQGLIDARPRLMATQALLQQRAMSTNLDAVAVSTEINLIQALGGGYQSTTADTALAKQCATAGDCTTNSF